MDTTSANETRQKLINRTIGITTLDQIEEARQELQRWLAAHTDDEGIREVDARLADMARTLTEQTPPSVAYRVRDQQEQDKPRVGVTVPNDAPARDER